MWPCGKRSQRLKGTPQTPQTRHWDLVPPAPRSGVVPVDGVDIPLISLDNLIETKRTSRLKDAADIEVLEEIRRLRV